MSDNDIEKDDDIPSVGDDKEKKSPISNNQFFAIVGAVVLFAFIFMYLSYDGGEGDDESSIASNTKDEYETAQTKLRLPSEQQLSRNQRLKDEYPSQAARVRAQRKIQQYAPPGESQGGGTNRLTKKERKEQEEKEKMWEKRKSAEPVVYSSQMEKDKDRRDSRTPYERQRGQSGQSRYQEIASAVSKSISGARQGRSSRKDEDKLSTKLGDGESAVTAGLVANKSYKIAQGKTLGCVLETAINSELPGMTRCVLSEDAFSYDGRTKLLPKGSRLVGQYEGGIQHGESRIFVIWERVITPSGIDVALQSPGSGPVGRAGHSAYVDSHFLERFGASSLLSIVGSLAASESEGDVRLEGMADSFNKSAEIALEKSINIRPTGHKNQGERISIFVARDINFKPVIELMRNKRG